MAKYLPGAEPENIRKRIATLFAKLDTAYPDKVISRLHTDHKKWGETVTELYRILEYPDGKSFLRAYGYTLEDGKSSTGRPKSVCVEEVIEALREKYPNGSSFTTVDELFADNPEYLPKLKTIKNQSTEVFGLSLTKYLLSIGLLKSKVADKPVAKKSYRICKVSLPCGSEELYLKSESKAIHAGDCVEFPVWEDLHVYGKVIDPDFCSSDPSSGNCIPSISVNRKATPSECNANVLKSVLGINLSGSTNTLLQSTSNRIFKKTSRSPIMPKGTALWACCRGLSVEILRLLTSLMIMDGQAYSLQDIILISDEIAELHVYTSDIDYALSQFPNIKVAMFVENEADGTVTLCYSKSGYDHITDEYEVGPYDPSTNHWTLNYSPVGPDFSHQGTEYIFRYRDDWDALNYVYWDEHGTMLQMEGGNLNG